MESYSKTNIGVGLCGVCSAVAVKESRIQWYWNVT